MCTYSTVAISLPTDVVVIGFSMNFYTVSEGAGTATLTVRVIIGTLQTQVSTVFSTSPGTAVGKLADKLRLACHRQQLVIVCDLSLSLS